ncbi:MULTISPECIES: replication initiation protein [Methylobacterium]|uniref:Initiator Rep protein WH1 domain-containing protein n=1 Tax=Methylobacterium isbiliense TaxID=315478 RepID=A0ABQ4SGF2_9HYPH|nr:MULTISPECIES: replication initiation protein [Methylobacterium]MBY0296861.1 replication initiation protein [Methylobacterium sp.]MDN3626769.1 replication initiation protein [Methylobacterium isbiliense]GJE02192.1 hypothetical protein GMJLKIPL_4136 [Methylobacterium isbiliense]
MAEKQLTLTFDLKPRAGEAIKPAELIQITGHHELTLNARRAITILWHSAHMQGIKEGRDYTVEIDDLKPDGHKGFEMVEEAVEALMRALIVIKLPDGKTRRVQFLGGNDMDDPDRPAGVMTYSFDKRLIDLLQKSTIWGKIAIPVLMSFTSKYAISLYENVAQLVNLDYKHSHKYTLEEFREMLGVPLEKYKTFGELNKHVIKPAVDEVNALAPFGMTLQPLKQGKKVTEIAIGWWQKDEEALNAAWEEIQRSRAGRRSRIMTIEHAPPIASPNRLARKARKRPTPKTS